MKTSILAVIALVALPSFAQAACYGTGGTSTCFDSNGNSYIVQQYGNGDSTTFGSNSQTGSQWSQSTINLGGGNAYTYGYDAQRNYWDQNTINLNPGAPYCDATGCY